MLLDPTAVRGRLADRPAASTGLLAALLVTGFVVVRLLFGTSLGGFVVAGHRFVDPGRTPDPLPITASGGGYDGQFVYRLAVDPWTAAVIEHGIELDNPAYRQQRIATPVLAWLLGLLPGISIPLALVLVNAAALVVAAGYAGRLAAGAGRHPGWGLVLAFPACMPISLGRDLTEPVAWAGVLAGVWYARGRRWPAAAAALTIAVLARETSLVVVAGLLAGAAIPLVRRSPAGRAVASRVPARIGAAVAAPPVGSAGGGCRVAAARALGWLVVPVAVGIGWQVALGLIWGGVPVGHGSGNLGGLPLLGVLDSLFADLPELTNRAIANPAVGAVVFVERFALLTLFGCAAVALLRRAQAAWEAREAGAARVGAAGAGAGAGTGGDGFGAGRLSGFGLGAGGRPGAGLGVGEAVAWALSVALALSLRNWITDVQFLRAANEAVGLSVLVLLGDPGRAGRLGRWLGAALVLGIALEYAVRQ